MCNGREGGFTWAGGIHGAIVVDIQDIGRFELIERMLERWVPVHSLERLAYEMRRP